MPHEEWVREKGYGDRWPITEGIFSGCKRIFGEDVSATKKKNMYHEVKVKFWAYNQLINLKNQERKKIMLILGNHATQLFLI